MRINKYVALATGLSRREADRVIAEGRVLLEGAPAAVGASADAASHVTLDGRPLKLPETTQTIMLHKPVGFVCSRNGQGSQTIYDLLPSSLHHLKPVGRLDKDSSGLLLLTNDGELAQQHTHPSFAKEKIYEIALSKSLTDRDRKRIEASEVQLNDGPSGFELSPLNERQTKWQITMHEGRNRQIRRTFEHLGYQVAQLHRKQFGSYSLADLPSGQYKNSL